MTTVTAPWWLWWVLGFLDAAGAVAVCWVAAGWAERLADWLRRDRVTPLLEDDPCVLCDGCRNRDHCDGVVETCDCTCGWDEDWAEEPLPPERTWEQMTSHQLPVGPSRRIRDWLERDDPAEDNGPDGCVVPNSPESASAAAAMRTPIGTLAARQERRPPWWETEQRQAYEALGLEFPSGLLARVREAAQ